MTVPESARRRRALIVNCYADETRRGPARRCKTPQALGPVFLAGGFNPHRWEIRLYNELSQGPLEDARLLGWPDLIVLTGLLNALDRMRHITAYARSRRPGVMVIGGGHAVRAFPRYCRTFLDVACLGDVEEMREVVAGLFGPGYAAEECLPRYDLAHWIGPRFGFAESSRYCNFRCSYCTLTGERRPYAPYPVADLRRQLQALGRKRTVIFLDNNFYGGDRRSFESRLACIGEARAAGQFRDWAALVTSDFFLARANLDKVRAAGCLALFSGVENFDATWTDRHNKRQNGVRAPREIIRECLEAGIVFLYGLMLDPTTRTVAELRRELEHVCSNPEITLPAYLSVTIPIPGTPFFNQCLDDGMILPRTRLRDLDSTTISLRTLDPLPVTAAFVRDLQTMRGFRARMATHAVAFARRYRRQLGRRRTGYALANGVLLLAPLLSSLPRRADSLPAPRTHVSTTEILDRCYRPAFRIDRRYAPYFEPLLLTDGRGRLNDELAADIEAARPRR